MKWIIILIVTALTLFGAVDINNASLKELTTLKGIGAKKAETIITFRKGHCFKNVSELTLVKGVGKKTLEKNKAELTVGSCKR